jgi:hypothetical protein
MSQEQAFSYTRVSMRGFGDCLYEGIVLLMIRDENPQYLLEALLATIILGGC